MHTIIAALMFAASAFVLTGAPPAEKADAAKTQSLEFRIAAERDPSGADAIHDVDPASGHTIKRYMGQFAVHGPEPRPGDRFVWRQVLDPVAFFNVENEKALDDLGEIQMKESIVAARRDGKYYVLLHDDEADRMVRDANGDAAWSLTFITVEHLPGDTRAVSGRLNDAGAARLNALTKGNLSRRLAICVDGEAITAPKIMDPVGEAFVINGHFTPAEADHLAEQLQAFVADDKP